VPALDGAFYFVIINIIIPRLINFAAYLLIIFVLLTIGAQAKLQINLYQRGREYHIQYHQILFYLRKYQTYKCYLKNQRILITKSTLNGYIVPQTPVSLIRKAVRYFIRMFVTTYS
jgi:hypothetical protein